MSPSPKILVLNGQVFQTPAWHRGMGKYSLELIAALNSLNEEKRYWSEIIVILSSKFPTEDSVKKSLVQRAPEVQVAELKLAHNEYDNRPVAHRNREVLDSFLDEKTQNDRIAIVDYVVLSLMQSEVAPAFSSLPSVHNYLLFYDLIPLTFHRTYLPDAINQKGYLSKLAELLRADTYLAISKTVANDLASVLGIDADKITSIDGGPIPHGHEPKPLDVPKPFILMPTGNDLRKNNRRGIEAFAKFNKRHNDKYHLVVTSTFQENEITKYKKISDKTIFTGNISGEELEYLYTETSALLFPTEYEGLGMPILEALEKDKPVACSDISVFQEMSKTAFSYFDPTNVDNIARALDQAISMRDLPLDEYKKVLDKFTWQRTAKLFYEQAKNSQSNNTTNRKCDLTIFSASPEESDYGAETQQLHSELSRISDTTYYMDVRGDKNKEKINYLSQIANTISIGHSNPIDIPDCTRPIYFIENSSNCAAVLMIALANPGVLILRETQLQTLWEGAVQRRYIHPTRYEAEISLNEMYKIEGMLASLLASQEIVIATSQDMKKQLELMVKKLPATKRPEIKYANQPMPHLVYPELSQNLALYDYPSQPQSNGTGSFGEFSKLLVEVSQKAGQNDG